MSHLFARTKISIFILAVSIGAVLAAAMEAPLYAQNSTATVTVNWNKVEAVSKTTPTLQVVVNPMLRPGSPIVANSYAAVRDLGADYVRYVPWLPYPKLGVAELTPPTSQSTS